MAGSRVRSCKLCGEDLNLYGPDYKGRPCPSCLAQINKTRIKCAGQCVGEYQIRHMVKVIANWEPGVKGGLRTVLHYCRTCFSAASSKAMRISNGQGETIAITKERLRRRGQ